MESPSRAGLALVRPGFHPCDTDGHCVGAMVLDRRPWIDYVPQGTMHRAAAAVETEAVDEHPVERFRLPDEPRFERRIIQPSANDLAALAPLGRWKVRLEE